VYHQLLLYDSNAGSVIDGCVKAAGGITESTADSTSIAVFTGAHPATPEHRPSGFITAVLKSIVNLIDYFLLAQ
jgi:hypothetical protein